MYPNIKARLNCIMLSFPIHSQIKSNIIFRTFVALNIQSLAFSVQQSEVKEQQISLSLVATSKEMDGERK